MLATIEAQDPRLGKVFASLVRHLHSFVKDTRPSQEEWIAGVMWLQRVGVMSVDPAVRFEWMLLSDTLGVSMLVQVRAQQSPVSTPRFTKLVHKRVRDELELTMPPRHHR